MSTRSIARRPTTTKRWWWVASVGLIVLGLLVIVLAPRGPARGPSIPAPIGQTSLTPGQGTTPPSATTPAQSISSSSADALSISSPGDSTDSAVVARFASYQVSVTTVSSSARVSTAPPSARTARAVTAPRVVLRSRPIHLSIPVLGVSVSVGVLGLNKDRTVEVPTNFAQPGWYKYGPTPGQVGSSVILGHVDNFRGPAVFFRIGTLRLGDHVIVREADKRTFTFRVIGVRMYPKSKFPDYLVYGPRPYAALQLVTCGGVFDHQTGSYLSNIVVYTALVK